MYLNRLEIQKFRNLLPASFDFSPHRNYIFGDNAQGKTNLIEAIYLLCLAKSFRTREETDLAPFGENQYLIEGGFISDERISHHIGIMFETNKGKSIKVDGKKLEQFSRLVGQFPIIVLSVNDYDITSGPPAQRRRFFNVLLSQSSSRYLDDLKQYEQVLKQRNTLLGELNAGDKNAQVMLEVWNSQLIPLGARIMLARAAIVEELNYFLADFYATITRQKWTLRVSYDPDVAFHQGDDIEAKFAAALRKVTFREKQQGRTLAGPHRDEFLFFISDNELRRYGSRGEHKSALVSLKAAEAQVLYKRLEIHPILLLDDLYAELDSDRSQRVLDLFDPESQVFVTGTSLDYAGIKGSHDNFNDQTTFMVDRGKIGRV